MLAQLVNRYCSLPGWTRQPLWKLLHRYLDSRDDQGKVVFMNYGYFDADAPHVRLRSEDEPHRYCLQLYDRIVGAVGVLGKDLLEVGCGRGGGASYVMRYLSPRSYTALDQSAASTEFCSRNHRIEGLRFLCGDAENLPCPDGSVDAVVNVESSRCYRNMNRFLSEVHRVLRSGGHLLFGDVRDDGHETELRSQFEHAGLAILEEEEITDKVVEALDRDHTRRAQMIEERAPRFAAGFLGVFAATRGSPRYRDLASGALRYWRFVLHKEPEYA